VRCSVVPAAERLAWPYHPAVLGAPEDDGTNTMLRSLQAIRAILAGEDATKVAARYPGRIRSALSMVDQMTL
jgi:hypothetical protein